MADLDPKDDLGGKKEEQGGLGFRGGEEGAEGQSKEHKAAAASGGGVSMETAEDEDIVEDRGADAHGWDQFGPDQELEDVFEGLNLHGEEEEDLDISGEVEGLIKEVRWLCLFRVHTMRPFSHAALLNSMRNTWACAQGVTFNIKGPNLFLAQCHCLGDWKHVMEGGPWQFR